jgi:hypothetical protein
MAISFRMPNRSVLDALDEITVEPTDQTTHPILTPSSSKAETKSVGKAFCFQDFLYGAYRDRTGDLRLAKPALSQLS